MIISDKTPEENQIISNVGVLAETQVFEIHENEEISINYIMNEIRWNRDEIDINDIFAYNIALNIINSEDHDLKSIKECRQRNDWPKQKGAIDAELNTLKKRKVFGPVVLISECVKL